MRARLLITLGAILTLAGLLTWGLWGKLEWSEKDIWVGYSGEARVNDFLAAQRLLERMGQRATSLRGLPGGKRMPGPSDVLILPRRHVRLSPGQTEQLLAWVRKGGCLIAEGLTAESRDAAETQDPLFRALGARLVRVSRPTQGNGEEASPSFDPKVFSDANRITTVKINRQPFNIHLGAWHELLEVGSKADASAGNDSGLKVLQYNLEKGRVFLFTELSCLANTNLAEADHADFLWALISDWSPSDRVWIVYREEPPSLWQWLKDYAWMVMISFAAVLTVSLWHAASRFGPRIPDPPRDRRSLLEHLAACGRFQWVQRDGRSLLRSARKATLARAQRVHPGLAHLGPDELCSRLSELSGLQEDRVFRALRYDRLSDARDFTEAIQTLDLLRKQL